MPVYKEDDAIKHIDNAGCKILGYTDKDKVALYHHDKIDQRKASSLNKAFFTLRFGQEGAQYFSIFKNAILNLAHEKGIINTESPYGPGIYYYRENILVVDNIGSFKIPFDASPEIMSEPIFNQQLIRADGKPSWINFDHLKQDEPFIKHTFKDVFLQIHDLVSQWPWDNPDMALIMTAFVMLTPFQRLMRWRPTLYINGPKGTGKTTFFENVLQGIYGSLVERFDNSTKAAIPRVLHGSSVIPIIDEAKENKHIEEIFSIIKLSSRGGNYTVATGKNAKKHHIEHMFWLGSVYEPSKIKSDAALESRIVKFSLKMPEKLILPSAPDQQREMASRVILTVAENWSLIESEAINIFKDYEIYATNTGDKINTRHLENFMYAMALAELAIGKNIDFPSWAIPEQIMDDGDKILESILTSFIGKITVRELINTFLENSDAGTATQLKRRGLAVVRCNKTSQDYIAIDTKISKKCLLKNEYGKVDILAPLKNVSGAIPNISVDFFARKALCVLIPINHVD